MSGIRLEGSCHCGNLRFVLESRSAPARLPVRACACTFCRRHGARTVTDPRGRVRFAVADERLLGRYRFGLRTADFLVCRRCGVYVGALMTAGARRFATVNIASIVPPPYALGEPATVSYGDETASERRARRAARWTPVAAFASGVQTGTAASADQSTRGTSACPRRE
ncbi:MAG: aldehyde-activating protein [Gammaproteobacteria bacterium]|nr:aldehyde-activating protein [Gammaproteobacteria bacterium]NIR84929.1 aldehyde-activating protein [Gammaproteobacteria bacterium]NIR91778.1 aldehyde-activating protein [Gammaproteobacteria bacterium]NIU05976.1 aldehyde-activating protein [Gammaproteobacteria bacterium]NIV53023.1 aldehyde-activating protein [Gammaproteobacteria bacterium]